MQSIRMNVTGSEYGKCLEVNLVLIIELDNIVMFLSYLMAEKMKWYIRRTGKVS